MPDPNNPNPEYEYEHLSDLADKGELTQETLQETLNTYALALQQEFESKTANNPENIEEYTRDFFKKNVHTAAAQIVHLSNNAFSESVRLRACQIVVREALEDARADGDPFKELLKELSKTTPTPDLPEPDFSAPNSIQKPKPKSKFTE